jgi:hypothetical protein
MIGVLRGVAMNSVKRSLLLAGIVPCPAAAGTGCDTSPASPTPAPALSSPRPEGSPGTAQLPAQVLITAEGHGLEWPNATIETRVEAGQELPVDILLMGGTSAQATVSTRIE